MRVGWASRRTRRRTEPNSCPLTPSSSPLLPPPSNSCRERSATSRVSCQDSLLQGEICLLRPHYVPHLIYTYTTHTPHIHIIPSSPHHTHRFLYSPCCIILGLYAHICMHVHLSCCYQCHAFITDLEAAWDATRAEA